MSNLSYFTKVDTSILAGAKIIKIVAIEKNTLFLGSDNKVYTSRVIIDEIGIRQLDLSYISNPKIVDIFYEMNDGNGLVLLD